MAKERDVFERTVQEAIRRSKLLFSPIRGNASSTGRASSTQSGLVPPVPNDATQFINGAAPPAFARVKDSDLLLSNITTNDVSVTEHGFAPKLPGNTTTFLRGDGAYATPTGVGAFPPALPTYPALTTGGASYQGRFSAEPTVSTITKDTDGRATNITDASGNWGSALTAAAGNIKRPRWLNYAFNRVRPGFVFDGANQKLVAAATKTIAQPYTIIAVLQNWKGGTANNNVFRDSAGGGVLFQSSGTQWSLFAGSTLSSSALFTQNTEALPDGMIAAPCVVVAVFNGASSILGNNGTEVTGAVGSTGISGTMNVGGDNATSFMHGILYELVFVAGALNATDRAALVSYYAQACNIGA